MPQEKTKKIDCWGCRHFQITHQPKMPYACQAMGFKSKALPCLAVAQVDGNNCLSFAAKPAPAAKKPQ
jgi:hypothetical protein